MLQRFRRVFLLTLLYSLTLLLYTSYAQGPSRFQIDSLTLTQFPDLTAILSLSDLDTFEVNEAAFPQFVVKEDGQELSTPTVEIITNSEEPIAITLVLDLSSAVPLTSLQAASKQFLAYLKPNDEVSLIGFNDPPNIEEINPFGEVEFTKSKDVVQQTIDSLSVGAESALYEAILKAISRSANQPISRQAIIVMSDGLDTASRPEIATGATLREQALKHGIPIFTVGFFTETEGENQGRDFLQILARESGGRFETASNPQALEALFQGLVDRLRLRFRLKFTATQARDGERHQLIFLVRNGGGEQTIGERIVQYPDPLPVPEITWLKMGNRSLLEPLPGIFFGEVLLVPHIETSLPITQVEYRLNGELLQQINQPHELGGEFDPYEWLWDTRGYPQGNHELAVIATNAEGRATIYTIDPIVIDQTAATTPTPEKAGLAQDPRTIPGQGEGRPRPGSNGPPPLLPPPLIMTAAVALFLVGAILSVFLLLQWRSWQRNLAQVNARLTPSSIPAQPPPTPLPPIVPPPASVASPATGTEVPSTTDTFDYEGQTPAEGHPGGAGGAARDLALADFGSTEIAVGQLDEVMNMIDADDDDEPTMVLAVETEEDEETVVLAQPPIVGQLSTLTDPPEIYLLRAQANMLGRAKSNHIVLQGKSISRQHAKIVWEDAVFRIYDWQATNPIKVNGQPIQGETGHLLSELDEITIGETVLAFSRIIAE